MRKKLFWIAPLALTAFAGFLALGTYVVMRLWNWLTPELFGWHTLTFFQALGLIVLCRLLFGGLGISRGPRREVRHRWQARWGGMTSEERERFTFGMRGPGRHEAPPPPAGV
ncbi:MAG: hypothetical protein U0527_03885 [Candidatus Eisenbacteria bacterium]